MSDRKIVIQKPALTPFNVVAGIIVAVGLVITAIRFTQGLGATTNLSDYNPWGIWIGFDLLVGVALAAGGYVTSAACYIFGLKRFHSAVRPAILTGFLGYALVVLALNYDVGRPWRLPYPFIIQQVRRMDRDHPLICPYFINSKMFVPADTVGVKMVPSTALRTKADRVIAQMIVPRELGEFCGDLCPYELMMHAARNTDVVILNYHHLFDRDIREQLYANLGVEPQDILLLIDEAHNCGDVITGIESVTLEERDLDQASRELSGLRKRYKGADAVQHVLPRLTEFIRGLTNSIEVEDWFDPSIFDRMIVRESLYKNMDEIVDDLIGLNSLELG